MSEAVIGFKGETHNNKTVFKTDFKSLFLTFPKPHDYLFWPSVFYLFNWLESQAYLWSHVTKT